MSMADDFDVMNKYTRFRTRSGATAEEAKKRHNKYMYRGNKGAQNAYDRLRKQAAESMKAFSGANDMLSLDNLSEAPKLDGLFSKKEKEQQEQMRQRFELRK